MTPPNRFKKGYRVFFDVHESSSGDFECRIEKPLINATDVLVILSPGSLDRCSMPDDWVRREISSAIKWHKNIIPIMSSTFVFPSDLQDELKPLQAQNGITIFPESYDTFSDRLINFLHSSPVCDCKAKRPLKRMYTLLSLLFLFILTAFGALLYWGNPTKSNPTLLLVGSGTVSNYLNSKSQIRNAKNICIFDAASYEALKMMHEIKNDGNKNLYVMAMSSAKGNIKNFIRDENTTRIFNAENLKIVEVYLGDEDNLQVILKPADKFSDFVKDDTITIEDLDKLLQKFPQGENINVFRTSIASVHLQHFISISVSSG